MNISNAGYMELLDRLHRCEKYFTQAKYSNVVKISRELFEKGRFKKCSDELDKLPSNAELLEQLVKKLKGKSIDRTLKKIQEGKCKNNLIEAKALSSLLTHICIECEHGNVEYKTLVPNIIERLNEVIYSTLRG